MVPQLMDKQDYELLEKLKGIKKSIISSEIQTTVIEGIV